MRTVALLSLALGAFGAGLVLPTASSGILPIGYGFYNDGDRSLIWNLGNGTKNASNAFTIKVEAWQIPDVTQNWTVKLSTTINVEDCGASCATETIDAWSGEFLNGTFEGVQIWTNVNARSEQSSSLLIEDNTATTQTDILVVLTCPLCSSSAELSYLTAQIVAQNNPRSYGAFAYKDNVFSDWYTNRPGEWGPTIRIDNIGTGDFIVVQTDFDTTTDLTAGGVIYYFQRQNTNWAAVQAAGDQATINCTAAGGNSGCSDTPIFLGTTGLLRSPKSAYTRGSFPDEKVELALTGTGTWYLKPFVTRGGTVSNDVDYRVIIGLNKVPSAATGLVPSIMAIVVLAFAALLA